MIVCQAFRAVWPRMAGILSIAPFVSFLEDALMMNRRALLTGLTLALLAGGLTAGDAIKSGPQVGEQVPGPFHPLNCNGEFAGKKNCLYCQNGTNPVAMVFAREINPEVTKLIKKIDGATAKNKASNMGSFVVFLSDSDQLPGKLKDLAAKEHVNNTILSVDNPAGPQKYNVAKNAAVTVVLYTNHTVKANFAFGKGGLKDKDIDTIVADVTKIVSTK